MEMKNSGLTIEKTAKRIRFQGNRCYSIEFRSDSTLRLNNYYSNTNWKLFIDQKDFTVRGGRIENLKLGGSSYNLYTTCFGKLVVNRLTLPMCKINLLTLDNSLFDIEIITSPE